ncbi:MAG: FAD-dependent oxidoreductase, partial [Pseudomonadota bacterium]
MKVAVIGAGMTGVATAELLRRAGHTVTLIDRLRPGDPGQTSYGNAGILASASLIPVSTPGVLAKAPGRWLNRDGPLFLRLGYLPRLLPWLRPFLARATPEGVAETAAGLAPLISDTVEAHEALAKGTPAEGMIHRGPWVLLYPSRAAYEAEAAEFALKRQHGLTWEEWDRARLEEWDPALGPAYQFAAAMDGHGWLDGAGPYLA